MLAKSLNAMLHPEHVASLSGGPEDLGKADYILIKTGLMRLAETTDSIRFAYIMGLQNEKIVILADSEPAGSRIIRRPGKSIRKQAEKSSRRFVPVKLY